MIFGYSCYLCDLVRRNSRHSSSHDDEKYLMNTLNTRSSNKTLTMSHGPMTHSMTNSKWSANDVNFDLSESGISTRKSTEFDRSSTRKSTPRPQQNGNNTERYSEYATWKNQYKNLISITPLMPQNQHIQSQHFRMSQSIKSETWNL